MVASGLDILIRTQDGVDTPELDEEVENSSVVVVEAGKRKGKYFDVWAAQKQESRTRFIVPLSTILVKDGDEILLETDFLDATLNDLG